MAGRTVAMRRANPVGGMCLPPLIIGSRVAGQSWDRLPACHSSTGRKPVPRPATSPQLIQHLLQALAEGAGSAAVTSPAVGQASGLSKNDRLEACPTTAQRRGSL